MANIIIEASYDIINELRKSCEEIDVYTYRMKFNKLEIDIISTHSIAEESLKLLENNNIKDGKKKKTIKISFDTFNDIVNLEDEKIIDLFEKKIIIKNGSSIDKDFPNCTVKDGLQFYFAF